MPPSPLLLPLRSPSELSSPYLVAMDLETYYEIDRTATFISSSGYTRVALQFPDELLKDSTKVVRALRAQLRSLRESGDVDDVKLYVMADTTYGSCCVDEVGALHVNADCVVHYGHTCLSPTSTLPAFFVFGKASISVTNCVKSLSTYALSTSKPIVVLFGLEYAHAVPGIKEAVAEASPLSTSGSKLEFHFADAAGSIVNPIKDQNTSKELHRQTSSCSTNGGSCAISGNRYSICGLTWNLPEGCKIDDHLLCWIGSDNSAFANLVLTFNGCEIVRYDATQNCLVTDFSQQRRILKRRYYLVEKAKDANIVGILVGTLGVAGYLHMIHQMKELISAAGKKAYTLVMGRPNPAKLANFPECDVFIYVSCAQTVLMDSKEFLAPVITPFEAMLALTRGREWTGEYVMEFRDLINLSCPEVRNQPGEPRFSFLQGGYVECLDEEEDDGEDKEGVVALVNATEKALQLRDKGPNAIAKGSAKSGAEFFAGRRSYHGLDMQKENSLPEAYLIGRSGRAAGYADEKRGSHNL